MAAYIKVVVDSIFMSGNRSRGNGVFDTDADRHIGDKLPRICIPWAYCPTKIPSDVKYREEHIRVGDGPYGHH